MLDLNQVHQGDCLDLMPLIPDASVHCVVTSPPYYGLRDYQVEGQIGLEETFDEWLGKMVAVFREVRRVLRPDGTFWLNIGDSYAATTKGSGGDGKKSGLNCKRNSDRTFHAENKSVVKFQSPKIKLGNLKPKDLIGQPWALAFALRDDGWYLRSDIIWAKPNPMPESVTDRPTKSHEHIFLLTKSGRYFYDADAVKEKLKESTVKRYETGWKGNEDRAYPGGPQNHFSKYMGSDKAKNSTGRNLRDVWKIPTQPFPEAHFATFPEKLPKLCIMAGTSERGCCPDCGAPWERMVEIDGKEACGNPHGKNQSRIPEREDLDVAVMLRNKKTTTGWQPTCKCENENTEPCIVLDPFAGAGTSCVVAGKLGRRFVGIELSEEYCAIARKRIERETRQGRLL